MSNQTQGYTGLPVTANIRDIILVVNGLMQGKSNNSGLITLLPNAGQTTVQDSRVGSNSVVLLTPLTASATGASAYVMSRTKGSFTINHMDAPATDCSFAYIVVG